MKQDFDVSPYILEFNEKELTSHRRLIDCQQVEPVSCTSIHLLGKDSHPISKQPGVRLEKSLQVSNLVFEWIGHHWFHNSGTPHLEDVCHRYFTFPIIATKRWKRYRLSSDPLAVI